MMANIAPTICPFCGNTGPGAQCLGCHRDKTAPRRICKACKAQTPSSEPRCHACGHQNVSELRWKVPVIVAMFIAAFIISVLIQLM
jgi:predicted amidophosphoribosyltransferase